MPEHQQTQQSKKTNTIFQKQATPISQTPLSNPYSIIQRAKINPKSLTHADIMQLQRTIGNQAVGRLLSSIGNTSTAQQATVQRQEIPEEETCPLCMQRQEIPEEEEPLQGKFESIQRQEIPEEEEPLQGKMIGTVQRQEISEEEEKCPSCMQRQEIPEEEEPLQGRFKEPIQRQEIPEEEEPLQGKMIETVQRQEIPEKEEPLQGKMIETVQRQEIPEDEEPFQTKRENNTGMPDNLKDGVESLSGIDISDVKVHYNSDKPAEVGALAYTQGTDIHVAPGQERHLPHEAWHVIQQAQGRVKPTFQMKNVAVNDDVGLEHEADEIGAKSTQLGGIIRSYAVCKLISKPQKCEVAQRIPEEIWKKMYDEDWKNSQGLKIHHALRFQYGAKLPTEPVDGDRYCLTDDRYAPGMELKDGKRSTVEKYNEILNNTIDLAVGQTMGWLASDNRLTLRQTFDKIRSSGQLVLMNSDNQGNPDYQGTFSKLGKKKIDPKDFITRIPLITPLEYSEYELKLDNHWDKSWKDEIAPNIVSLIKKRVHNAITFLLKGALEMYQIPPDWDDDPQEFLNALNSLV